MKELTKDRLLLGGLVLGGAIYVAAEIVKVLARNDARQELCSVISGNKDDFTVEERTRLCTSGLIKDCLPDTFCQK